MSQFIGREEELKALRGRLEIDTANLIVINGRRRIGKSRLIKEFAKPFKFYQFSGLPPRENMTAQDQRNEFLRQMHEQFDIPKLQGDDWGDLFSVLAKQVKKGRVIILLDEISWLAFGDADFLGKLKIAWDLHFSLNSKLVLVLCGSVSSWIEKNILSSTGYLGRPSLHMTIDELPLKDCNEFWKAQSPHISAYEKLKLLAITGGVPRYLELINTKSTAEDNIKSLYFTKNSPLFDEFNHIFSDIYEKRSETYIKIIKTLLMGKANQEEVAKISQLTQTGNLSEYLEDLRLGGFISRDYTWHIKTGEISKLSNYRLKDNYTRFYLKYILPNRAKIENNVFSIRSLTSLPGWNSIIGLQFENLVINNHKAIIKLLGISPEDIIFSNPYFQRKTLRSEGCQIDYMIQTKHDTVYICEIKFTRSEIGIDIINEVKKKMNSLALPKSISRRAVLIHVNGVHEEVYDNQFFYKIIDFGSFLDENTKQTV